MNAHAWVGNFSLNIQDRKINDLELASKMASTPVYWMLLNYLPTYLPTSQGRYYPESEVVTCACFVSWRNGSGDGPI